MIFNLGHGGEAAGKFILERVLAHQEEGDAAEVADDATTKRNAAAGAAGPTLRKAVPSAPLKDATKTTDEDGVSY